MGWKLCGMLLYSGKAGSYMQVGLTDVSNIHDASCKSAVSKERLLE